MLITYCLMLFIQIPKWIPICLMVPHKNPLELNIRKATSVHMFYLWTNTCECIRNGICSLQLTLIIAMSVIAIIKLPLRLLSLIAALHPLFIDHTATFHVIFFYSKNRPHSSRYALLHALSHAALNSMHCKLSIHIQVRRNTVTCRPDVTCNIYIYKNKL